MLFGKTFRMVYLKGVSCNEKLVKTRFIGFIGLQNLFFLEKNFGGTRHPCEKNEPTLDHSGGGVHGEACWLIA